MALSDDMIDQLYVAPDRIGTGIGSRMIATAKAAPAGRPRPVLLPGQHAGADLLRAPRVRRRSRLGDGSSNAERSPTSATRGARIGRRRRPDSAIVRSPDGTPIAVFTIGDGPAARARPRRDRRPHDVPGRRPDAGATRSRSTRSTGAAGAHRATRAPYAIEREFEDVAAVAEALAADAGAPRRRRSGTRTAGAARSGAALLTDAIRRVVSYEGAPTPARVELPPDGHRGPPPGAAGRRRSRRRALATFLTRGRRHGRRRPRRLPRRPGLAGAGGRRRHDPARARGRSGPGGLARPARAPSASRSSRSSAATSLPVFGDATARARRAAGDGRIVVIDGARHAAHHTHPDAGRRRRSRRSWPERASRPPIVRDSAHA